MLRTVVYMCFTKSSILSYKVRPINIPIVWLTAWRYSKSVTWLNSQLISNSHVFNLDDVTCDSTPKLALLSIILSPFLAIYLCMCMHVCMCMCEHAYMHTYICEPSFKDSMIINMLCFSFLMLKQNKIPS